MNNNGEIKFNYPETLEDITVAQYSRWNKYLHNLLKKGEDEVKQKLTSIEYKKLQVSTLCNLPLTMIDLFPLKELNSISKHLTELTEGAEMLTSFEFKGKEFRIVPDFENLSVGEFVDASEFFRNPEEYHKLIAVLYREVKEVKKDEFLGIETYSVVPYNEVNVKEMGEFFKELPATVIVGLTFFLLRSYVILQKHTLQYFLGENMGKTVSQEEDSLTPSMDGSTVSID